MENDNKILQTILETVESLKENSATKDDIHGIKGDIHDVWEAVEFIKDNAAIKDDLKMLATKDDILVIDKRINLLELNIADNNKRLKILEDEVLNMKDDLLAKMDGFMVLNQKLDIEFISLKSKCARLEIDLLKVMKHLNLEAN